MLKKSYSIVGAMSGSSLDGLDLCVCQFNIDPDSNPINILEWEMVKSAAVDFPDTIIDQLQRAPYIGGKELILLHAQFGKWLGQSIKNFLIDLPRPDFISSHGHTVFHFPEEQTTLQIGCGAQIAALTSVPTITDFRKADMANGGVGAPFAPMADVHLYPGYDFYMNMGGIANITNLIDPNIPTAWDICPFNQLLNHLAQQVNHPFDLDGQIARSGQMIPTLLNQLKAISTIQIDKPNGMDNQYVTDHYITIINQFDGEVKDKLATCVHFICDTIVQTVRMIRSKYKIIDSKELSILATGGGAFNNFLMHQLSELLTQQNVLIQKPSQEVIQFKEAALMALLGLFRITNTPTSYTSVTGAIRKSIGGVIHQSYSTF